MNHKQLMFYEIMKVLEYEERKHKNKSTSELYLCHNITLVTAAVKMIITNRR